MLTISTNIASLSARRTLMQNSNNLSKNFQRLSSGLRINGAEDDAAGLAISKKMTAQIRGLNQAVRNASDSMSMAQTAESALNEIGSMLQRTRELAVQSANDTYTASDRVAIQEEASALLAEMDRIATQTEFNTRTLLDGSSTALKFQVGANEGQNISFSFDSARTFALGAVAETTSGSVTGTSITAGEIYINGEEVRSSVAADDTVSFTDNAASAIAKAAAINASAAESGVVARVNETVVTTTDAVTGGSFVSGDFTVNGVDIGDVTVQANDADFALRNAINAVSNATGVTASLDGSNQLVLTAVDGRNVTVGGAAPQGNAGGVFSTTDPTGTTYGTVTLESDRAFSVTGSGVANAGLSAETTVVNTAVNVSGLDLGTQTGADSAIGLVDKAIRQVSSMQSDLGALLNRMDAAVSNLSAASENISAARGRIRDADFAAETAEFSKNQILQQASTAMLAQANVSGQVALQLIGG